MVQYLFEPFDKSWKVIYDVHKIGTSDRSFFFAINSEKSGVHTVGLLSEGQALGLFDEYVETTITDLIAKGVSTNCTVTELSSTVATTKNTAENTANYFLTFAVAGEDLPAVIDTTLHTVTVTLPYGTNVAALQPTFTVSPDVTSVKIGATAQVSGVTANNFAAPKTYAITAEHGEVQNWVVTVVFSANTENDFLTFSFAEQTAPAIINVNNTITITVANGTDPSALVATFTLSDNATANIGLVNQVSGVTANNFTAPLAYNVASESGSDQAWLVTVTVAP